MDDALEAVSFGPALGSCDDVLDGMLEAISSVSASSGLRSEPGEDVFAGVSTSGMGEVMRGLFRYISCLFGCWLLRKLCIPGSFVLRWCLSRIECLPQRMTEQRCLPL